MAPPFSGAWGYPWVSDRVNATTNLRRAHGKPWLAAAGLLAWGLSACGNESVNVFTPRDSGPDVSEPSDTGSDVATQDAAPQDISLDAGPDAGPNDVTSEVGPVDATRDASADMPGSVDGPTTGCQPLGGPCSFAGACCFLACPLPTLPDAGRTCSAGPQCGAAGDACMSNADCCADRCVGGFCGGFSPGTCLPAGERCAIDNDCCGARCKPTGGGDTRCALLDACRVFGEVCVTQYDCCSGQCGVGSGGGVRVCLVAPACTLDGRVCRGQAGDRCTTGADCCTDQCSPVDGVLRCTNTAACGGACALCVRGSDCCSNRCMGDENGDQRCE